MIIYRQETNNQRDQSIQPLLQKLLSFEYSLPPEVAKFEAMSFSFYMASPSPLVYGSLLNDELEIDVDPEN